MIRHVCSKVKYFGFGKAILGLLLGGVILNLFIVMTPRDIT